MVPVHLLNHSSSARVASLKFQPKIHHEHLYPAHVDFRLEATPNIKMCTQTTVERSHKNAVQFDLGTMLNLGSTK